MFASARATRMLKATRHHRRARSSRARALCNRLPMKARQIKTAAAATTPPIPTSTASSAKPKKIALLDHGFRRRARRLFCKGNERAHLRIAKADAHRRPEPKLASEHLAHRAVELDPMQDVAVANVEDISAAARLAVARLYVLLELEALERAVARQRGGDQSVPAPERRLAGKAWAERDPPDLAALLLDAAEIAAAGIEHPQHPGIELRRVRHGEILGDDAVGLHVDQDAAFITALAPAIDNIAARGRGRILRHAFLHG